jgi:hypothetical protein
VFVSYAHEDKRWVREIGVYLRALASSLSFELWDDTRIAAGAVWREEISAALSRSRVAVLVLTPEYMASEYLSNDELPALLDAAEAGGVTILCVYASDVRLVGTAKALSGYQFVNAPDAPLSGLNQAERDKVYVALAEELEKALTTK